MRRRRLRTGADDTLVGTNAMEASSDRLRAETIVDNLVRVMPALLAAVERMRGEAPAERARLRQAYVHEAVLAAAERCIRTG